MSPHSFFFYCYIINIRVPGRGLGFHRRDSRGDWHLYRRPSADDRRGFPKPGRCTKHNRHGVFPVGINQSCGNPSFQLSDILFFFYYSGALSIFSVFPHLCFFLVPLHCFRFFFPFSFCVDPEGQSQKGEVCLRPKWSHSCPMYSVLILHSLYNLFLILNIVFVFTIALYIKIIGSVADPEGQL